MSALALWSTAKAAPAPAERWGILLRLPRARVVSRPRSQARHIWRIATIDRYLFRQAALRFAAVIAIVVVIMTLENGPRLAADLSHTDTPWALLWNLSADLVPEHLAIALPVATLLAVALTARSLALRGEWQVFATAGLAPARIMAAPLALALLAAVALLWNGLELRPRGEQRLDALYKDIATGAHGVVLPLREPVRLDAETTLVADGIAADAPGELTGIVIRRDATVITAARANVASDGQGGIALRLTEGTSIETRADGSVRQMSFGALTLHGRPPGLKLVAGNLRHRLDRLDGAALWRLTSGAGPAAVRDAAGAALLGRVEGAIFCLLLPWIAIAVGVPPRRRPGGPALLVGVGLIVLHLQTAALVEDRWAAHALLANALHLAAWTAAAWGLSRLVRRHGDGAIDLFIERTIAVLPRLFLIGAPIGRLARRFTARGMGGTPVPALQPVGFRNR
ncbi:LptF/LptG family permease [uncultured Sphingomonas sp.]|uniref:LptF/LptG family permease n=1 Tax=uncultured Sphingomonas sp. TaxID=158754 RepID=UPI0035CA72C7